MQKKIKKEFKAVEFMRKVGDEISKDIQNLDYQQVKEYINLKNVVEINFLAESIEFKDPANSVMV